MAEIVQKIINGNTIRHGDLTANVNKFGTRQEINTITPDGALDTDGLTDRLGSERTRAVFSDYVTIPGSGQEVSYTMADGVDKILFKARTNTDITFGFNSGDASGLKKTTLFGGTAWESPTQYDMPANQAIYFSSFVSGTVIEINYWR